MDLAVHIKSAINIPCKVGHAIYYDVSLYDIRYIGGFDWEVPMQLRD